MFLEVRLQEFPESPRGMDPQDAKPRMDHLDQIVLQNIMTASPPNPDMAANNQGVKYPSAGRLPLVAGPKFCPGVGSNNGGGYLCESGHCCGDAGCCTYYYQLWWFWLLWTVLILFSCCCAYRYRRAKLRNQQQQRQREINLIAYHRACNYPASSLDLSFLASFKLPSYEEVAAQPRTPPPSYSTVFALQGGAQYVPRSPSGMTSSQSSDNYTSCSCESCSSLSPSSTWASQQGADETNTSNASTPGEVDESRTAEMSSLPPPLSVPVLALTDPLGAIVEQSGEEPCGGLSAPKLAPSPAKHALFSSSVDFFEQDCQMSCASDAEDEEGAVDGGHYRPRRLTADSGIEVCRCQGESEEEEAEEEEEEAEPATRGGQSADGWTDRAVLLHDRPDCSIQAKVPPSQKPEEHPSLCGPATGSQQGEEFAIAVETM